MRAEVQHHLLLTTSENHRVGEGRHSGYDFDGTSTSIVENTPLESPAVDIPNPACYGAVDNGSPEEDENHHRDKSTTFGDGSYNNGGGNGAELHLEKYVRNETNDLE